MDNNKFDLLEQLKQFAPFIVAIALSSWGGIVNYVSQLRMKQKRFSWKELSFDLIVSSFAGLLTFFFCQWSETNSAISAILIATSGHMGTRAIARFETIHNNVFKDGRNDDKRS